MLLNLDASQIKALIAYANQGGNLVVVEPFGAEDKYARPRSMDPLAKLCPVSSGFRSVACGEGRILRLEEESVPKRQSDLWCLMEERANAFIRARDFLDKARKADLESGTDLGPQFVARLEESLGLRLRWCPPETDAGIFVQPYQIPAVPGRPARLVVHVVNYRVPIVLQNEVGDNADPVWSPVTRAGKAVVARNLRITVPLSEGANVKSVQALSPTDKIRPVRWTVKNGRLTIRVKELRIYQALVIDL